MREQQEAYTEQRERKRRRRQRELQRKIFGFCVFTFLLGVLCGKIVFAKDTFRETDGFRDGESEAYGMRSDTTETGEQGTGEADTEEPELGSWQLVLVNKWNPMEKGYRPETAEIENNYEFDARAVEALKQMLADGRKEGLDFWVCSAYRTIQKQTQLYENKVSRLAAEGMSYEEAYEEAKTEVAYPGTSEHNLGLAVDIVARDYQILDSKQAQTEEAQWLEENCWRYGFILRYPPDKKDITGVIYEPWHYRYVGKTAAQAIMEQGICLEEYLEELSLEGTEGSKLDL